MNEGLPIYRLTIDDENEGVDFVALVNSPAIERNFQAFSKKQRFTETAKRVLSGALMVPDMPIYRNDTRMGECMVMFDRDTIYKIAQRFFRNQSTHNVNAEHSAPIDGVYMFESFIIDRERGINPPKGEEDLPDGTWYGSFKVDNDTVWTDYVQTGKFKGFSVEGDFGMEQMTQSLETELAALVRDIGEFFATSKRNKHLSIV